MYICNFNNKNYFETKTRQRKTNTYNNKINLRYKNNLFFGSGWNDKVSYQIHNCDVDKIVKKLKAKYKIDSDFKGNKVVAWCSYKTVKIFKKLNRKYNLNLKLPNAIYVEDFSKFKENSTNRYGFCNMYPAYLLKDSEKVFKEGTVFFNSFSNETSKSKNKWKYNWENIDAITEDLYKSKISSSSHFLNMIIHEFCHAAHIKNLFENFKANNNQNAEKLLKKLREETSEEFTHKYKKKFGNVTSKICEYASEDPLETIACDMSAKIDKTLDSVKLYPAQDPFAQSSYPKKNLLSAIINSFKRKGKKDFTKVDFLKKIWEGEDLI